MKCEKCGYPRLKYLIPKSESTKSKVPRTNFETMPCKQCKKESGE
jgi:hypothetical protein